MGRRDYHKWVWDNIENADAPRIINEVRRIAFNKADEANRILRNVEYKQIKEVL